MNIQIWFWDILLEKKVLDSNPWPSNYLELYLVILQHANILRAEAEQWSKIICSPPLAFYKKYIVPLDSLVF